MRKELGRKGEQIIARYLKTEGFTILASNYAQRHGELDLVARKDDLLVFVEVKLRRDEYFPLSQVITAAKQRKIIRTARFYIAAHNLYALIHRFDVGLVKSEKNDHYSISYIPNAFTAAEY